MNWLAYNQDEVADFHPEFAKIANLALTELAIDADYQWLHHPQSSGVGVIPDFVLVDRHSGRWIVIVEIKRRPDAVTSERNQIQAKGYAEANDGLFRLNRPRYFLVTNLEIAHLFAARGGLPPKDCLVEGMSRLSGSFKNTQTALHQAQFLADIKSIISFCIAEQNPSFASVWPRIARLAYEFAGNLPFAPEMDAVVNGLPPMVREYFSIDSRLNARRELLLRCMLIEYLRGLLLKHDHPQKNDIHPIGTTLASVANALVQIRAVDFSGVFENGFANTYLNLENNAEVRGVLEAYLHSLQNDNVSALAATRGDSYDLPVSLIRESASQYARDARGKAATDEDLAGLLAALAITNGDQVVLDPGCGEGNLISAAYDVLREMGLSHSEVMSRVRALEADTLAVKIAALRLALKEPRLVRVNDACHVQAGDMFSASIVLGEADVILMNPPFKRYEVQDDAPLPAQLREHCRNAIQLLGQGIEADQGQSNLFTLYLEFVIKAAKPGATIAVVLDNKWYHNETTRPLRELILRHCTITGVVTYPHSRFFEGLMIATSMVILEKSAAEPNHRVTFARVENPGTAASGVAASIVRDGAEHVGWSARRVHQTELNGNSWKSFTHTPLLQEYRFAPLRPVPEFYARQRRGSLAKEGGGIAIYEFPLRTQYGPRRLVKPGGAPFQTNKGLGLTLAENTMLAGLADAIPPDYRGYAINKADRIEGYEIAVADVSRDWTVETPRQRNPQFMGRYRSNSRAPWTADLDAVLNDLRAHPATDAYISCVEQIVGLDEHVLPREQLWNVLREPYAGELVIPRKQRAGHRVHSNPFALLRAGRQVRLSSNFLTYCDCLCADPDTGLSAQEANRLVIAWLLSSFGHLQFELEGNNREGVRSLEQHHVEKIFTIDPRHIRIGSRQDILEAVDALPYPIRTDIRAELQPELVHLDELFAQELHHLIPNFDPIAALSEVWARLHEAHQSRNS